MRADIIFETEDGRVQNACEDYNTILDDYFKQRDSDPYQPYARLLPGLYRFDMGQNLVV